MADSGAVAIVVLEKPRFTVITGVNTLFNRLLNAPGLEKVAATNGGAVGVPDDRSAEAVIAHCRANLAGYKAPKHVAFRDTLPKTAIGKVLRRRLKEEALGA